MQKTFDITIDDQQPVNPNNSFAIYRGDNVAFNFTFQRGGVALDVEGATLRIFAKKIQKNGQVDKLSNPLFAEDFIESNTATFNSDKTSGDAGNYILSVLLLSSEQAVITSQCIYFELKENGYAGYYQPSEDFRDAIFDASQNVIDAEANAKQYSESAKSSEINAKASEQSANTSETNAKASENTARTLSQDAEQYSRNAKQSANDCAESVAIVQSAEGECLEAVANAEYYARQSQEASERAIAITDPEGFRTSTAESIATLSEAVVGKVNKGELYFNSGKITCSQKWKTNEPFSLLFTLKRPSIVYGGTESSHRKDAVYTCGNRNQDRGFTLSMDDKHVGFYYHWAKTDGTQKYFGKALNVQKYFDNKPHAWAYVFSGSNATLKIDGTTIGTNAVEDIAEDINTYPLTFEFPVGSVIVSRAKVFNFDITSADAPYTIADYISGKDESPLLHGGAYNFNSQSDWLAFHSNEGTFASSGNDLTFTASEDVTANYLVFYVNANVKAGTKVEALIDSVVNNSSATTSKYSISAGATATNDAGSSPSSNTLFGTQTSFTTTKDSNKLAFWIWKTGTFATGESLTLVNPQIKVNGALLSLEDYIFNGKVFDTSGNNNTATITGVVKGTRDNAVEQMYQAFASRIQNLTA